MKQLTLLAALAALSLAAPALAQEPPPAPAPAQPTVTLTVEQLQALVAKAAAPATVPAPAAAPAPVAAKASAISSEGVLGLGWETILATLGTLLAGVFAALKGATALKVRRTVQLAAETGWLVSERLGQAYGLPGAQKASLALGEFLKVFSEAGIAVPPGAAAQAEAIFKARSAEAGLAGPPAPATPPVDPAKLAAAQAAAAVASKPGSATDLANEASK